MSQYIYKSEPVLLDFKQKKAPSAAEVKKAFDDLLARELSVGWEYVRLDSVPVQTNPGCLGAFSGQKPQIHYYTLAVFRRAALEGETS